MYEFETEVDINVIGDHQTLGGSGKAKIKWVMTIEARDFGVKCFGIYVPEQTILATIVKHDEETDGEYEAEESFTLENVLIDDNARSGNIQHLQLIPSELEVYNGKFELKF